jgi:hypothetical protein
MKSVSLLAICLKSKTPTADIPSAGVSGLEAFFTLSYDSLFPEQYSPLADGVQQQHICPASLHLTE